jgi:hypothetical protein
MSRLVVFKRLSVLLNILAADLFGNAPGSGNWRGRDQLQQGIFVPVRGYR